MEYLPDPWLARRFSAGGNPFVGFVPSPCETHSTAPRFPKEPGPDAAMTGHA